MKTITKLHQSLSPFKPRLQVAAYVRVSHSNLEHSYSNQVSFYNDLIQRNQDWEFSGIYSDFAISGKSQKHRSDFQRLIQDCREGKIDIVLTKSISRFGRNTVELLQTVRELRGLGISVRFEKEGIDSLTAEGEFLITLLASLAQEESTSLSQNVKWKVKERFKQGIPYVGQAIYGYRWNGEEYVIEPHEAHIVRQVFEWYVQGIGVPTIAKRLNKMGEKTRLGNAYTKSILYEFFKQEAYYGTLVLQKTYREDFCRNPKRNTGQRTRYIVENAHEPIISKALFEQAQALKSERSKGRFYRKDYSDALFKDKVYCQHCGKDMLITKERKHGYRYNCRTRQQYGKDACPSKTLSERRLIQTLEEHLFYDISQEWVDHYIEKVTFDSHSYSVTIFGQEGDEESYFLKKGHLK